MAANNVDMGKIKQVMRMLLDTDCRGKHPSNREIGRVTGLYKGTVNDYVKRIEADPLSIEELLKLDDPVLERRLCGGNAAYSDPRFEELSSRLEYLHREMQRKHVTLQLLYEEYCQDVSNPYSYSQFCFHYNQHKVAQKQPTMILAGQWVGGEKMFLDFAGDKVHVTDPETGEIRDMEIFIATLPASDYPFAMALDSQRTEHLVEGTIAALNFYGGVPRIIVTDNLKASIIKADRYQPEPNKVFEDLCNHYGAVLISTRSAKPRDKALVEDEVKLVYRRVLAPLRNRKFFSKEELNAAISEQMWKHRQKRMRDYDATRQERFLAIDRPKLQPLPSVPFEIKCYAQYTVQHNSHIKLTQDGRWYSVPGQYIGQTVKVIYTPAILQVFHRGVEVAIHSRLGKEKYVTKPEHMPSYHEDYRKRSPARYIDQAAHHSIELEEVMKGLFASNPLSPPETFYKSADGLLSLSRKTDRQFFIKVCKAALKYGKCTYAFIKKIIDTKGVGLDLEPEGIDDGPASHDNIRGPQYYSEKYY